MTESMPELIWDAEAPAIERAAWLGAGDTFVCYLINGAQVVRIARDRGASAALRREERLLPELAGRLSAAIPRPLGGGRVAGGERFVCYELVEGTPLEPATIAALAPDCQDGLARQMARFARELHAVPPALGRSCGLPEADPRRSLPAALEQAAAFAGLLTPAAWRCHQRLLAEYLGAPGMSDYQPALLHGDLSPDHFVGDPAACRLAGVIDFGDACLGDPLWDLIYILEDYGPAMLERFLAAYAADQPAAALRRAGRRVRLYQRLNNVAYCLAAWRAGEPAELAEALAVLERQAAEEG